MLPAANALDLIKTLKQMANWAGMVPELLGKAIAYIGEDPKIAEFDGQWRDLAARGLFGRARRGRKVSRGEGIH